MTPARSNPLEPFQWKNRLVLYQTDDESLEDLADLLEDHEKEILDRDLLFLRLGNATDLPFHHSLENAEIHSLRSRLAIEGDSEETASIFFLIGKDGGVKGRQTGDLDLEEWFVLIDSMPMRQREMRQP